MARAPQSPSQGPARGPAPDAPQRTAQGAPQGAPQGAAGVADSARVTHLRRGRPPRGEAAARRQERARELARAAAFVLARQGVRATTMDSLAEALGVPKAVLYRYYPSKDELLHAILRRISDLWQDLQAQPWKGLSRNLQDVIALTRANPDEFLILARHCAVDPELRVYYDALHASIVTRTANLLARSSPSLARDDLMRGLCSQAVAGFLIDAVLWWIEYGARERDAAFVSWARQSLDSLYRRWMPDVRWRE